MHIPIVNPEQDFKFVEFDNLVGTGKAIALVVESEKNPKLHRAFRRNRPDGTLVFANPRTLKCAGAAKNAVLLFFARMALAYGFEGPSIWRSKINSDEIEMLLEVYLGPNASKIIGMIQSAREAPDLRWRDRVLESRAKTVDLIRIEGRDSSSPSISLNCKQFSPNQIHLFLGVSPDPASWIPLTLHHQEHPSLTEIAHAKQSLLTVVDNLERTLLELPDRRQRLITKAAASTELKLNPFFLPTTESSDSNRILAGFSVQFLKHSRDETNLVDYDSWHAGEADWGPKDNADGLYATITYGEIKKLWAKPNLFVPYESKLHRFAGSMERTFLVDPNTTNEKTMRFIQQTLFRHVELGFRPRINSPKNLLHIKRELGIEFDACAVLNGKIALFYQLPRRDVPCSMVRTTNSHLLGRLKDAVHRFWGESDSLGPWYDKQYLKLREAVQKSVEIGAETVRSWSGFADQQTSIDQIVEIHSPS